MFINEFITIGLNDYFNDLKAVSFEKHVIECICDIYGKEEIKKVFLTKDQNAFIDIIKSFGYPDNYFTRFLSYTIEYEKFKETLKTNPEAKTNILSRIEAELITMFSYKWMLDKVTDADIERFEKDLLNDFEVIRMKFNHSMDPNIIKTIWSKQKHDLQNSISLNKAETSFLETAVYKKFDLNKEDVQKMDYRMVEQLNKSITDKLKEAPEEIVKKPFRQKFVLSSGNGFVDILMMVSIIGTIASIGIIAFLLK